MEWLSMMLGTGRGWLEAALLIGFFWAALVHPDRIRSVTEFRIATLLLGVSMVVPVMVSLFLVAFGGPRQPGMGQDAGTATYAMAIAPLLSMMTVILGVDSVTPRSRAKDAS